MADGDLEPQNIDENTFDEALRSRCGGCTTDPDLLLRTGGQRRLSNFLLFQVCVVKVPHIELSSVRPSRPFYAPTPTPSARLLLNPGPASTCQAAYTEIAVVDTLWPDFGTADLVSVLTDFAGRQRTFGIR